MEFLDVIKDKNNYYKRFRNYFSGKYEIIEIKISVIEYEQLKNIK